VSRLTISETHYHLAARFARFHELVSFSDVLKTKYAQWVCFVPAGIDFICEGVDVRERKPACADQIPEKAEVNYDDICSKG
jgi:hypothetical protein